MKENNIDAVNRRRNFLINTAYCIVILAMVLIVIRYALSALMPFVIAAAVAAILRGPVTFLNRKLKFPKRLTGIVLTVIVYFSVALVGILLADRVVELARTFFQSIPSLWSHTLRPALQQLSVELMDWLPQLDIDLDLGAAVEDMLASLGSSITQMSRTMLGYFGNIVYSLPSMLISIIICIVSTLFILFDWDKIRDFLLLQLSARNGELAEKITRQSSSTIRQFIVSYGLILLITFSELSIGLSIIGFEHALLLAAGIAIFDILPILGCGAVLIPWSLISFIIGATGNGLGLAILYIIITVVRNVTEPKIVGKQVGLHPLVTLMSMVIGSSLMGGVGLFGLPITLAVINKMNKEGVLHLFKNRK